MAVLPPDSAFARIRMTSADPLGGIILPATPFDLLIPLAIVDKHSSRCGFHDERISAARSVIDPDALRLEKPVDRLRAVLTTET